MTANHDLTTEEGLRSYLTAKRGSPPSSVQLLTGGTANYVYRVKHQDSSTSIFKHAAPYLHSNKAFAFDPARMDFEARILGRITPIQDHAPCQAHAAQLFDYDSDQRLLNIEDGGEMNLKEAYSQPWLDIPYTADQLATWLANLHTQSTNLSLAENDTVKGNNPIGLMVYRHSYNNLHTALTKYGHDTALAERINEAFGSRLVSDDECVCHGDFWPGNVLIRQGSPNASKTKQDTTLTIVDWEMVRRGTSATDVGQFAAEAFLLDRFRGGRHLRYHFLSRYVVKREASTSGVQIGREWIRRMAVHWAVHISYWPTRVPWTDDAGTRELVEIGVKVLQSALDGDWESLKESPLCVDLKHEWRAAFEKP